MIRIHVDTTTIDIPNPEKGDPQKEVERIASKGVWDSRGEKFYPAKNIVFIELMREK